MIGSMPSAPVAPPEETLAAAGRAGRRRNRLLTGVAPVLALFTSLVFCGMLLLLSGNNPLFVYQALWTGAVTGPSAFPETLVSTTPYILLGLAVAVGFKAGVFNIGAEGQFILGAIGATWAGHLFPSWPAILQAPFALLAGVAAGAAYAALAGVLKVYRGAHEVITTIMLNYVAGFLISWLVDDGGAMHGTGQIQQSYYVSSGAALPIILGGTRLHAGLIIALLGALVVYVFIWRTTWGFALRAVGLNPPAARSAGISLERVTLLAMTVSGALAGLAGAIQITGLQHVLPDPFASGLGFDAIAVAIIGAGHPVGIILAGLLLGALRNGATTMEQVAGISGPFVSVIEGAILFFVAAPVIIHWLYFHWWERRRA